MGLNQAPVPAPPPEPADALRGRGPERASSVRVEIGELVLEGFGAVDSGRICEAFQRELTRLVTERGVPVADAGDRAVELLSGLPELPATTSSRRLGEALARAVHAGLAGCGGPTGRPADRRGR
jgi:hypothetical protein